MWTASPGGVAGWPYVICCGLQPANVDSLPMSMIIMYMEYDGIPNATFRKAECLLIDTQPNPKPFIS